MTAQKQLFALELIELANVTGLTLIANGASIILQNDLDEAYFEIMTANVYVFEEAQKDKEAYIHFIDFFKKYYDEIHTE